MTHDPFDLEMLEDGVVSVLEPLPEIHRHEEPWIDKFLYDRYHWADFDPPYGIIMLNRGYFMMVDKRSLKRFKKAGKWTVHIRYDCDGNFVGGYAVTRANGKTVYAQRFATHAAPSEIVDHALNGYGLDNRLVNLRVTTQSHNIGNAARREHSKHTDLPPGVAKISVKTGVRFRAQIQAGKKRIYSPRFKDPVKAALWYVKKHKELFPIRLRSWVVSERREPIFPPERKPGHEYGSLPGEAIDAGFEVPF